MSGFMLCVFGTILVLMIWGLCEWYVKLLEEEVLGKRTKPKEKDQEETD